MDGETITAIAACAGVASTMWAFAYMIAAMSKAEAETNKAMYRMMERRNGSESVENADDE